MASQKRILLVDCDGTIRNPKKGKHINRPQEQRAISSAKAALEYFNQLHYKIIGVTNQAGVAANHKSLEVCIEEQRHTLKLLPTVDSIYFCPDFAGKECWYVTRKDAVNVSLVEPRLQGLYRKPNAGMLELVLLKERVAKEHCIMVGDRDIDSQAAVRAHIRFVTALNWWENYTAIANQASENLN